MKQPHLSPDPRTRAASLSLPRHGFWPLAAAITILLALMLQGPAEASLAASERWTARAVSAAVELDRLGRADLVIDLVREQLGVDLFDAWNAGHSLADLVPAAGISSLGGLSVERSLEMLSAGWTLPAFADQLGLGSSDVEATLSPLVAALEGGLLALGGPAEGQHGPGDVECDESPGHGPHHGEDCEPGDGPGPGGGPGPGDGTGDGHGPHDFGDGEDCPHEYLSPGPHGHGCDTEFSEEFEVDPFLCEEGREVACLAGQRFEITVEWSDFDEGLGQGQRVDLPSSSSALFWFFDPENYELLVKVLDGCAVNGHYWIYAAATTNVEYALTAIDSETGLGKTYFSPLHLRSRAIADVRAFDTCP